MIDRLSQLKIPRKYAYWYLHIVMLGCIAYWLWAAAIGRPDATMGITGGMVMLVLIKNFDTKGKWSDIDTLTFVAFGLTTAMIPFID